MTTLQADVAIAGAGLAGMSLALDLARAGRRVVLLERRSRPGGAIRTVPDPDGQVDAGIHLFLAGFTRCLARLEQLGSRRLLRDLGTSCEITLDGQTFHLPMGAPLPIGLAMLARVDTPHGRGWQILGTLAAIACTCPRPGETAEELLKRAGSAAPSLGHLFWSEWALSVFNAPLAHLDAGLFRRTIGTLFLHPGRARPLLADGTLDDLWIKPFIRALAESGVNMLCGVGLRTARLDAGGRVRAFLGDEISVEAKSFVWAGQPEGLAQVEGLASQAPGLPSRSLGRHIVNLLVPVESGKPTPRLMRGWFSELFQWVFPAGPGRVSLVGSGWTDAHLERRSFHEARAMNLLCGMGFGIRGPARWLVQRHATHLPSPVFESTRRGPGTSLRNLYFCGAWLNTGLPQSMESALAGAELCRQALPFE